MTAYIEHLRRIPDFVDTPPLKPLTPMNRFVGIDSYGHPRGLMVDSVHTSHKPSAVLYETVKMDVCGDGSGRRRVGDTFQPETALKAIDGTYLNADAFVYFVLPDVRIGKPCFQDSGLGLGDIVAVLSPLTQKWTYGIYGDIGPWWKIGEASIMACRAMGFSDKQSDPVSGGFQSMRPSWTHGFIHLAFPKSRDVKCRCNRYAEGEIIEKGAELVNQFFDERCWG